MKSITIPKLTFVIFISIFLSCSKTEENIPLTEPVNSIAVDFLREAYIIDQTITFGVLADDGTDLTAISTFYIDGQPIAGNTFSSSVEGEFLMKATYLNDVGQEITTPEQSFKVIIPKRKIVVEDYTGTWCGWCPRVAGVIHDLEDITDDIVVVAIHEEANNIADPLHFPQIQLLKNEFNVNGFPAGRINRTQDWISPYPLTDVTSIAGLDTDLAIAINSDITDNVLSVDVDVVYQNGSNPNDKLVVYLLEDGIISDQYNYLDNDPTSPFYQLGNPIDDFIHNDGLRHSFTDLLGNPITQTESEYRYSTSFNIPADYVENNLKIVAMVVSENNTALNAQYAQAGESAPYE